MIKLTHDQAGALLKEVRFHKPDLSKGQASRIFGWVEHALIEYQCKFRSGSADQIKRLESAKAYIDHAISKTFIDEQWQNADDDTVPLINEKAVLDWLSGDQVLVAEVLSKQESPILNGLWKARLAVVDGIEHIEFAQKSVWAKDWNTVPSGSWKKQFLDDPDLAQLVFDLAKVWTRYVDPSFGLPQRTAGKANPFTRYCDTCLLAAVGELRPSQQSVKLFAIEHIRPIYRKMIEGKARQGWTFAVSIFNPKNPPIG